MEQMEKELIEAAIITLEKKLKDNLSYTEESNYKGQLTAYRRVLDLGNGSFEAFRVMNGIEK